MPVGMSLLSVFLAFFFSFLAIQCTGVTDITPLTAASKASYVSAFKLVYLSSLSFAGISLVVAFFSKNVDQYMTSFLNKRVDGQHSSERENTVEAQMEVKK